MLTSWNSIRPQASSDAEKAAGKLSFRKSAAATAAWVESDADVSRRCCWRSSDWCYKTAADAFGKLVDCKHQHELTSKVSTGLDKGQNMHEGRDCSLAHLQHHTSRLSFLRHLELHPARLSLP